IVTSRRYRESTSKWYYFAMRLVVVAAAFVLGGCASSGPAVSASSVPASSAPSSAAPVPSAQVLPAAARIHLGHQPCGIVATGTRIWVSNYGDGTLRSIDPATNRPGPPIPVGASPCG